MLALLGTTWGVQWLHREDALQLTIVELALLDA